MCYFTHALIYPDAQIKHFIFQSVVVQIIAVVPTRLHIHVVLEEDLVVMTAIAKENSVVVMATVKTFIPQLLRLVVVAQHYALLGVI